VRRNPTRDPGRRESRPGRPALVADSLDELHGPTTGTVELPHRLMWQADRRIDLDDAYERRWMYEMVLREAIRFDELRAWLDGPTLYRLWPEMILPRGLRHAWEERHPQLGRVRLAAH
jgi:hypothetical protein